MHEHNVCKIGGKKISVYESIDRVPSLMFVPCITSLSNLAFISISSFSILSACR